jgi:hypothetical protein
MSSPNLLEEFGASEARNHTQNMTPPNPPRLVFDTLSLILPKIRSWQRCSVVSGLQRCDRKFLAISSGKIGAGIKNVLLEPF